MADKGWEEYLNNVNPTIKSMNGIDQINRQNQWSKYIDSVDPTLEGMSTDTRQKYQTAYDKYLSSQYTKTNGIINRGDPGYPKTKPENPFHKSPDAIAIQPEHHNTISTVDYKPDNYDSQFYVKNHDQHLIRDLNDPTNSNSKDIPVTRTTNEGDVVPVFSASVTNINPYDDPNIESISKQGIEPHETARAISVSGSEYTVPPTSPIHPFVRMNDPQNARIATLTTYNRTKTPIADLEFRKSFRHTLFTRPECYIMALNNGKAVLSEQAEHDSDFASCYSRMPYILDLLSPIYVTGSFSQNSINSNWNYLLSNRILSISTNPSIQIGVSESVKKSASGFTVSPAGMAKSDQGATIEVSFRETKDFAIYEMMRMWILYMHKRKRGIFSPSYNGYKYRNGFLSSGAVTGRQGAGCIYHPYDRALDYCCSLFDIITNESDTKILYWWKYYGIYPTDVSLEGLSSENGGPIAPDSLTCNVTFKYHCRLANDNKILTEFNYNAGITDDLGRVKSGVESALKASMPFLKKDDDNRLLPKYIGASGMFTGSPYIVMGRTQKNPLDKSTYLVSPYLQFMPIENAELNKNINLGITNILDNELGGVVGTLYESGGTSASSERESSTNVDDDKGGIWTSLVEGEKEAASNLVENIENSHGFSGLWNDLTGGWEDNVINPTDEAMSLIADTTVDSFHETVDTWKDKIDKVNNFFDDDSTTHESSSGEIHGGNSGDF